MSLGDSPGFLFPLLNILNLLNLFNILTLIFPVRLYA